jgi:hypothetical protein
LALTVFLWVLATGTRGAEQQSAVTGSDRTNSFPDLNEVFQGRAFNSKFERDVFFLRQIRDRYPSQWSPLLAANIVVSDYELEPDKLLHFVEALGTVAAGTDDLAASTHLAAVASDPAFYANTNAYRPGILRAAAGALIKIGPTARQALAASFCEEHYRADSASLEVLADAVSQSGVVDARLRAALVATVFTFTATNGGCYAGCARAVTRNLLTLPEGTGAVASRLTAKEALADPVRFQAITEGIAAANAVALATNLAAVARELAARLDALPGSPDAYRDALVEYQTTIRQTLERLPPRKGFSQ